MPVTAGATTAAVSSELVRLRTSARARLSAFRRCRRPFFAVGLHAETGQPGEHTERQQHDEDRAPEVDDVQAIIHAAGPQARGSSTDKAAEMAQVIREAGAQNPESDPQRHLPAPQRPERKAGAEDDARRDADAMERDHFGAGEPGLGTRLPCRAP